MANYNQISYGSRGSDVTELQKLLNQNGYKLDTDGIFGDKTLAAVKEYQSENNLSGNGNVDENTWNLLSGASNSSSGTTPEATTPEVPEVPKFSYDAYKPNDTVAQAEALLQQHMANKPGAYQSTWQDQLNEILQQIQNREEFSYDLNGDALYQQYKDQYTTQGKLAMMDAMGQAAAMTGGYGNSYAQTAGQQAYQAYLQQLNDVVPELYALARDQYNRQGDDMYNQYALMAQMEEQDYGRYMDEQNKYYNELDYLTGRYDTERDADYSKWYNDLMLQYQMNRDNISDEQWQAQFDEAKRQFDLQYELSKNKSSGGGGGGGGDTVSLDKGTGTVFGALAGIASSIFGNSRKELEAELANITTYSDAYDYLKSKGYSTAAFGLMNQREWQNHKNKNNSAAGEHLASSYQEYLETYIFNVMTSQEG